MCTCPTVTRYRSESGADENLRRAVTDANPSVREQAAEVADKLGRYLSPRKLRNEPPPPVVPPPLQKAVLLSPRPVTPPLPPTALAAPPAQLHDTIFGPPEHRRLRRRRVDDYDDDEMELFDQVILKDLLPMLRDRARKVLNRFRRTKARGVSFGPRLGQVYVDGHLIPDLAGPLNDALGRSHASKHWLSRLQRFNARAHGG